MTRYKETLKPELTLSSLFVCFTQLKMTSAWSGFPHSRAELSSVRGGVSLLSQM